MNAVLRRWWSDESGQDLIEYALLTGVLGFAAYAGINVLQSALNSSYASWDAAGQSDALVEVPDP